MAEENPYNQNGVTCDLEKTGEKFYSNPSRDNDPIFQALKDREYDGKFKKGTRIHTVERTVFGPLFGPLRVTAHYF